MSTRVDILAAKATFEAHAAQHKCTAAYLRTNGQAPCAERAALWAAYMGTAGRWADEPGDAAKVTEQYAWQTALLGQHVQMAA
jgi:hypothetical protein